MSILTLEQVQAKQGELKEEIKKRLRCDIKGFKLVKHESGAISVHWYTVGSGKGCIYPPVNWVVFSVDWNTQMAAMYADPSDFLAFNS